MTDAHNPLKELLSHFSRHATGEHDPPELSAMERKLLREVADLSLSLAPEDPAPVTDADLADLPATAQRYLRFMGVVGRPRDRTFRAHYRGRFFIAGAWEPCECAQFNSREEVARIFHMRVRVKGVLPTYVRDTYVRGAGRMLGKALDAVKVVDDSSEEVAVGECVTWLNDAVLFAPSMLLHPRVTLAAVDDGAFDVALTDGGRTVRARVLVDEQGAVTDFVTIDRYYAPPGATEPPRRCEWRTPIEGWFAHEGRRLMTRGRAVWMLPEGPLPYVDFTLEPGCVTYDAVTAVR